MLCQLIMRRLEGLHQCLVEVVVLNIELLSLHGRCLEVGPLLTYGACHVIDLAVMCCGCCVRRRQLLSRNLLTMVLLLRRMILLILNVRVCAIAVDVDNFCCI